MWVSKVKEKTYPQGGQHCQSCQAKCNKYVEGEWLASEPSFWMHFDVALGHQAPGLIPLDSGIYTLTWSPESPSYWLSQLPASQALLFVCTRQRLWYLVLCENESKLPSEFPHTDNTILITFSAEPRSWEPGHLLLTAPENQIHRSMSLFKVGQEEIPYLVRHWLFVADPSWNTTENKAKTQDLIAYFYSLSLCSN